MAEEKDKYKQIHKKPYQPPVLTEWGDLEDLTQGQSFPGDDGVFGTTT